MNKSRRFRIRVYQIFSCPTRYHYKRERYRWCAITSAAQCTQLISTIRVQTSDEQCDRKAERRIILF